MKNNLSFFIFIPKGAYYIPKVHKALKVYRIFRQLEEQHDTEEVLVMAMTAPQWQQKILRSALYKFRIENETK